MTNKTPVLEVKDLGIDFGGLTAVNNFNMRSHYKLTEEEQELARRGRNLPIPVARRSIQHEYRPATAFEVLIGYWYIHDKTRLNTIFDIFKQTEWFNQQAIPV